MTPESSPRGRPRSKKVLLPTFSDNDSKSDGYASEYTPPRPKRKKRHVEKQDDSSNLCDESTQSIEPSPPKSSPIASGSKDKSTKRRNEPTSPPRQVVDKQVKDITYDTQEDELLEEDFVTETQDGPMTSTPTLRRQARMNMANIPSNLFAMTKAEVQNMKVIVRGLPSQSPEKTKMVQEATVKVPPIEHKLDSAHEDESPVRSQSALAPAGEQASDKNVKTHIDTTAPPPPGCEEQFGERLMLWVQQQTALQKMLTECKCHKFTFIRSICCVHLHYVSNTLI